jgi:hypothetical protein
LVWAGGLGDFEAPCFRFAGEVPCLLDLLHYKLAKKKISPWAPAKIMNELTASPTTICDNHNTSTTGSFYKTTFANLVQLYSLFLFLFFITSTNGKHPTYWSGFAGVQVLPAQMK